MESVKVDQKIDPKKVKRIINRVIFTERINMKTKELSDPKMIEKLQKIVEEEVECF